LVLLILLDYILGVNKPKNYFMKKVLFLFIVLSTILTSCKTKDKCVDTICPNGQVCVDGTCQGTSTNVLVTTNITSNTTWTSDNVYELAGRITVTNGATLTIEAGTVIKGQVGTGANATALLIARGGKLNAVGTATLPIIFTSVADEITPELVASGNFSSPNLDPATQGLWGGVIVLGRAPISASANEIQIEGIPTTDANGLYGGTNPDDNSGVLKYVSIRHGGANIGNGNEINGLTLGGVGSGTVIENIEIVGNQDDGVEFFGGNVNVSNLIIWYPGDDGVDTDQAWGGTLDNFIVICGAATDHALEIDGPEGTYNASHIVKNGTIKGHPMAELGDFRACPRGSFQNLFFFDFPDPAISGRGDLSISNPTSSTCSTDNLTNGVLTFSNLQVILPVNVSLTSVFLNGTSNYATSVSNRTVGASKSQFNWTWSEQAGQLVSF
jgi:hypothetical protein